MFERRLAHHPQFDGLVRIDTEQLPDNTDQATDLTIKHMCVKAAEDSTSDLIVRSTIDALPREIASFYDLCRSIHEWIRSHVKFVRDTVPSAGAGLPADTEVLIRPMDILRMREPAGDCDCMQTLCASMLLAARRLTPFSSLQPRFRAVAADSYRPREFSHVYTIAVYGGTMVPVDVSHGPVAGWEARNRFSKRRDWSVDGVNTMLAKIAGGGSPFLNGLGADVAIRGRRPRGFGLRGFGSIGDSGYDPTQDPNSDLYTGGGSTLFVPPASTSPAPIYIPTIQQSVPGSLPVISTPSASAPSSAPSIWDQALAKAIPGAATSIEQIATNLTRPAGLYQVTGPGGQSVTYQMPTAGPAAGAAPATLNLSTLGSSASGSWILWGGILLAGVLALKAVSGGH